MPCNTADSMPYTQDVAKQGVRLAVPPGMQLSSAPLLDCINPQALIQQLKHNGEGGTDKREGKCGALEWTELSSKPPLTPTSPRRPPSQLRWASP